MYAIANEQKSNKLSAVITLKKDRKGDRSSVFKSLFSCWSTKQDLAIGYFTPIMQQADFLCKVKCCRAQH